MIYRTPWVDEDARRLDEAEITAFRSTLRAKRWRAASAVGALLLAGAAVTTCVASYAPRERSVAFDRKPECLYDGCFCRDGADLVQTSCPPRESRSCLPIAGTCER